MKSQERIWIAVLGYHRASLWSGSWKGDVPGKRLLLDPEGSFENPWEELIEESRPSRLPGAGRNAEFLARFAGDVGRWLGHEVRGQGVEHLTVFCPTRLWSLLRPPAVLPLALEWRQIGEDLSELSVRDLERHEAVLTALAGDVRDSSRRAS